MKVMSIELKATSCRALSGSKASSSIVILPVVSRRVSCRFSHPANAFESIMLTVSGIDNAVRAVQPLNALLPISPQSTVPSVSFSISSKDVISDGACRRIEPLSEVIYFNPLSVSTVPSFAPFKSCMAASPRTSLQASWYRARLSSGTMTWSPPSSAS